MTIQSAASHKPWLQFYPKGVGAQLDVPQETIHDVFDRVADTYAKQAALVFYGKTISYTQLREESSKFAASLKELGVGKGTRVALYLLNSPQFVIAYLGVLKAGGVVVPVSAVYTAPELKHLLQDSGAEHIVCQDIMYDNLDRTGLELSTVIITGISDYLPPFKKLVGRFSNKRGVPASLYKRKGIYKFADLLKRSKAAESELEFDPAQDLASMPYTGGTTGKSKGVMLTHTNILACLEQFQSFSEDVLIPGQETMMGFLPFNHIYGQVAILLNALTLGCTLIIFTTPDVDDILFAMERHGATVFNGVPTLYERLKQHPKTSMVNWQRLKFMTCGADTLHDTTRNEWEERTGVKITEGYGMTETSGVSHLNPNGRIKAGSFGLPIPNVDAIVVDPETLEQVPTGENGELLLHGPSIMQGYWNREEANRETFAELGGKRWLRTGDLVSVDEEGYFFFYDRGKDRIKTKGFLVFPREIEEVLYAHPKVKGAGVVGVPDREMGHYIKAFVVLQAEARGKVTEEELRSYLKERLAHYKVPRVIEFRGELPKTDVGKVSRRELREDA